MPHADPKERARYQREYHAKYSERGGYAVKRRWSLKNRYGMTLEEYDAIFLKQDGRCAICKSPGATNRQPLHVDHNHETGKVRGLLCHKCNLSLGMVENKEFLEAAHAYLRTTDG